MKQLYDQIAAFARQHGATRLVLFGSRARGDHTPTSDIDLAVYGMPLAQQAVFWNTLEELPTLLKIDVVHMQPHTDAALCANIQHEGVTLMDKYHDKLEKLCKAVARLAESVAEYDQTHSDSVRDGAIQRFEFCTELTWKTLRERLLDVGYVDINAPKTVLRTAFSAGLLQEESLWLSLIADRNLTSHLYDEAVATQIYHRIAQSYLPALQSLADKLNHDSDII